MKKEIPVDGVLLCGGKGTRLRSLTNNDVPKSLFPVADRELIQYSLDLLPPSLVPRLIFAIDYKAEQVQSWVEQMALIDYLVRFSHQDEPGVLAALMAAMNHVIRDSFIVCNTDEIRLGVDLLDILLAHSKSGKLATIVGTHTNNLSRHRVLEVREKDNLVLSTRLKPEEYKHKPNTYGVVNTGLLVLNQQAIDMADSNHSKGWSGLIDPLTDAGELNGYIARVPYFNVGTPAEYQEASSYLSQEPQQSRARQLKRKIASSLA